MQEETMLTADEGAWQVSEWKITQQQGDRAACDNDRLRMETQRASKHTCPLTHHLSLLIPISVHELITATVLIRKFVICNFKRKH